MVINYNRVGAVMTLIFAFLISGCLQSPPTEGGGVVVVHPDTGIREMQFDEVTSAHAQSRPELALPGEDTGQAPSFLFENEDR